MAAKAKTPVVHVYRSMAEMAAGERPRGLVCPRCWAKQFRVDATRMSEDSIVRYRVCRSCGCRWRTDER